MMNIVVPMAGRGRRFSEAGFTVPKMMIDVAGRPMLYWALDSLRSWVDNGQDQQQIIFVCLKEHLDNYPLERLIYTYYKRARIVAIEGVTGGQAQTVLAAKNWINENDPLLIYNCDTYTESSLKEIFNVYAQVGALDEIHLKDTFDGVISVFRSEEPCYSYVKVDQNGFVERVEEKTVISWYASTGLYYFSQARFFMEAAEAAIAKRETVKGEYYIAPLYNKLIEKGHHFICHEEKVCHPLGTPEQLAQFESKFKEGS